MPSLYAQSLTQIFDQKQMKWMETTKTRAHELWNSIAANIINIRSSNINSNSSKCHIHVAMLLFV